MLSSLSKVLADKGLEETIDEVDNRFVLCAQTGGYLP
jgi:hypothetical protein